MRISSLRLVAVPVTLAFSLWSTTVLAQATDAGAAELLAVFQTYLGSAEGTVAVAVDGDAYSVTIDSAPLLAKIPAEGMTASLSPLVLSVTDNGDGTWGYEMDQAVTLDYAVPGVMTAKTNYSAVTLSGVFDEALGDSSEYRLEFSGVTSEQTQTDPTMGEIATKMSVESGMFEGTAEEGDAGLDSAFTSSVANMSYDMTLPGGEGMPPTVLNVAIAEGVADGTMTGYQPEAFYGMLAWFVAHPDAALIEADKAGLKAQIEKSLPLFGDLMMTGAYKDIVATTPMGPVTLDEVAIVVDANGVVADGKFREAISVKGLTLPEGMLPPFAAPLVPSEFSIDMAVSKFDPVAGVAIALGLLDLPAGAETPLEFDANMMAALLPSGVADFTLAPGRITAPAYTLTYEGAMSAGPASAMPVGKATVTLKGMAEINAALMASPPEMGMQDMAPMFGMAEMMAKPGDDGALVWELETTAEGGLLVNGTDMMGGGQ
jgi:hypothetical protein